MDGGDVNSGGGGVSGGSGSGSGGCGSVGVGGGGSDIIWSAEEVAVLRSYESEKAEKQQFDGRFAAWGQSELEKQAVSICSFVSVDSWVFGVCTC
jgi:hypothetical protein